MQLGYLIKSVGNSGGAESSSVTYLEFIWGGVGCLWGINPEYVCQAAGNQQTHVLVWVFEEEVWGQVEGQVQVQLLLFLRVLVHVHEGLHNHLEERRCRRLVAEFTKKLDAVCHQPKTVLLSGQDKTTEDALLGFGKDWHFPPYPNIL